LIYSKGDSNTNILPRLPTPKIEYSECRNAFNSIDKRIFSIKTEYSKSREIEYNRKRSIIDFNYNNDVGAILELTSKRDRAVPRERVENKENQFSGVFGKYNNNQ